MESKRDHVSSGLLFKLLIGAVVFALTLGFHGISQQVFADNNLEISSSDFDGDDGFAKGTNEDCLLLGCNSTTSGSGTDWSGAYKVDTYSALQSKSGNPGTTFDVTQADHNGNDAAVITVKQDYVENNGAKTFTKTETKSIKHGTAWDNHKVVLETTGAIGSNFNHTFKHSATKGDFAAMSTYRTGGGGYDVEYAYDSGGDSGSLNLSATNVVFAGNVPDDGANGFFTSSVTGGQDITLSFNAQLGLASGGEGLNGSILSGSSWALNINGVTAMTGKFLEGDPLSLGLTAANVTMVTGAGLYSSDLTNFNGISLLIDQSSVVGNFSVLDSSMFNGNMFRVDEFSFGFNTPFNATELTGPASYTDVSFMASLTAVPEIPAAGVLPLALMVGIGIFLIRKREKKVVIFKA